MDRRYGRFKRPNHNQIDKRDKIKRHSAIVLLRRPFYSVLTLLHKSHGQDCQWDDGGGAALNMAEYQLPDGWSTENIIDRSLLVI